MLTSERLPNWPPPDGERIGMERARTYYRWIRENAPPLIAEAERWLRERNGTASEVDTAAWRLHQFADLALEAERDAVYVGCVTARCAGGSIDHVDIRLRRDGRLEAHPGWEDG